VFVAVVSSHGHPESVYVFDSEAEAKHFAEHKIGDEGWEDKKGHTFEHEGHTHEYHWVLDFGDEDGCGIVVGEAHDHEHDHHH
jgi:hypothetical protein